MLSYCKGIASIFVLFHRILLSITFHVPSFDSFGICSYSSHILLLLVETAVAPALSAAMTSLLSLMSPPAMTGV